MLIKIITVIAMLGIIYTIIFIPFLIRYMFKEISLFDQYFPDADIRREGLFLCFMMFLIWLTAIGFFIVSIGDFF